MKKMIMPLLAGFILSTSAFATLPNAVVSDAPVTHELREELRLSLFPNPNNTGFVKVMVDNVLPEARKVVITITRPDGRPAFSETYNFERAPKQFVQGIDISDFEPGVYTVSVTVADKLLRQRLVVR